MQEANCITIISNRKKVVISINTILYVLMTGKNAEIHDITDRINLSNGEFLIYTLRKKNEMMNQFRAAQKSIIDSFPEEGIPSTEEEYRRHYSSFEHLPFAFTVKHWK